MTGRLEKAIRHREAGELQESRRILLELVAESPNDAEILYQCGWSHDRSGLEREALGFYERAFAAGLSGEHLHGAYLAMGSTLRGLGEFDRAIEVLEKGVSRFPEKNSLRVFLAMAHYNVGRSKEALESCLKILAETTSDQEIKPYRRAIFFYAEDLDRTE